jgi:hypothetical protein
MSKDRRRSRRRWGRDEGFISAPEGVRAGRAMSTGFGAGLCAPRPRRGHAERRDWEKSRASLRAGSTTPSGSAPIRVNK